MEGRNVVGTPGDFPLLLRAAIAPTLPKAHSPLGVKCGPIWVVQKAFQLQARPAQCFFGGCEPLQRLVLSETMMAHQTLI